MEWPASPWPASAPESPPAALLQAGRKAGLELAVLELVARGWLQLVEVRRTGVFGRYRKDAVLTQGRRAAAVTNLSRVQALWQVYGKQAPRAFAPRPIPPRLPSLPGGRVSARTDRSLGRRGPHVRHGRREQARLGGWIRVEGSKAGPGQPRLGRRGAVSALGLFPATRWRSTPPGVAAQGDLLWRVDYGNRELGRLVDDAPEPGDRLCRSGRRRIAHHGRCPTPLAALAPAASRRGSCRKSAPAGGIVYAPADTGAAGAFDSGALVGALYAGALDAAASNSAGSTPGSPGLTSPPLTASDGAFSAIDAGVEPSRWS